MNRLYKITPIMYYFIKETLLEIQQTIEKFMEERGLKLSDEKTVITNINDGFDFLGWNFRKFKGKLLIQPSRKSKQKVTKVSAERSNTTMRPVRSY